MSLYCGVTPYVGVWIETRQVQLDAQYAQSLLMWECGLKPIDTNQWARVTMSLLMWECGLKHTLRD